MPEVEFYTAATTSEWIDAAIAVVVAIVIAKVVDHLIARRAKHVGELVTRSELSPAAETRLRLIRRLLFVVIVLIGVSIAVVSAFPEAKSIATAILASSAVLGLVIGFAARQTLANGIAGILLAVTQPIRLGDLVTFEEESGVVEDMKLTYTYIRLDDGRRLIVPNERLAQSSVINHTILDPRVQVEVSVWLPADADLDKAIELITNEDEDIRATVVEVDKEGVRLTATTWASGPAERGRTAAELRRRWLRLLREHSLSSAEA